MSKLLEYTKRHPLRMLGGAVAVAGLCYGAYKLVTKPVYADDAEDVDHGEAAALTSKALAELGATSVLTSEEGSIIGSDFIALARTHSRKREGDGEYVIDFPSAMALFEHIGIKDQQVAGKIFQSWDKDGSGSISMKEFLMSVLLTMRGTRTEKLHSAFSIMDIDGDHVLSQPEVMRFLRVVDGLTGVKRSPTQRAKEVEAMFATYKTKRIGYLNREEFMHIASNNRFHLGESLEKFFDDLQEKFSTALTASATTGKPLSSPRGFTVGGAAAAPKEDEGFKAK